MPNVDDTPLEACEWIRAKLVNALGQAKLWPLRLATVRHQENLRS